jgi:peptidoglycan/LPS O-acetylase OafA/YrhL
VTTNQPVNFLGDKPVRKDIQALRALAVGSVVAYHAGLPVFNSGFVGVDIFFVISGYLIIGLLVREQQKNGRINLLTFVGRRARRLIPASSLVLLTTVLLIWLMLPGLAGQRALGDVKSAAFYFANIDFARTAMDYWATQSVGPVIHFWSLGVEEQFYIFFPILLVLVFLIVKKQIVATVTITLVLVSIASFLVMMNYMNAGNVWAFYGPQSRAWEFAIGGIAATFGATRHFKKIAIRRLLVWLGWVALLYSVIAIDPKADFPSSITLIPVFGAALVLWLGSASDSDDQILHKVYSLNIIQKLGDLSYSTYLWHWPVLYFGARYVQQPFLGPEKLSATWAIPLILLSFGLAAATYKWIENPFRHAAFIKNSGLKSLVFGLSLSLVVALVATLVSTQVIRQQPGGPATEIQAEEISNVANPEAVAKLVSDLAPKHIASDSAPLDPNQIVSAQDDFPDSYSNGCHAEDKQGLVPQNCTLGPVDSKTHVYLFGNSHANMFFTPISDAAIAQGSKFTSKTRSGCSVADVVFMTGNVEDVACNTWRTQVLSEVLDLKPDLVIMSNSQNDRILDPTTGIRATPDRAKVLYIAGLQKIVNQLSESGIKVILIRDTPRLSEAPLDCLSAYLPEGCQYSVTESVNDPEFSVGAVGDIPGVLPADLTLALCGTSTCESVRTGTIVWRDSHHITDTYARELTPMFSELLKLQLAPQ